MQLRLDAASKDQGEASPRESWSMHAHDKLELCSSTNVNNLGNRELEITVGIV